MYQVIRDRIKQDADFPDRYYNLMIYQKIRDGNIYDCFSYGYHQEYQNINTPRPEYIPEELRAPCVNTGLNLMRSVVEQSVGFLWGEDRFPNFALDDENTKQFINDVVTDTHLVRVMQDAVTKGSIGSVALHLKVLNGRFFIAVFDTVYLTPSYDPQAPDTLVTIVEKRKVLGSDLAANGYVIEAADYSSLFWFQRIWDKTEEIWFVPMKVVDSKFKPKVEMQRDETRTVTHNLGLVPWVWAKNLVGTSDQEVDGRCTFEPAIENCIQIDYQMSRVDRAMKYNCDPLTVIKTRNTDEVQDFVRRSDNAMVLPIEGDADILEISGDAASATLKIIDELKDEAMSAIHGSRADPDKLATSQSSVAQRMLYLPMVQLASHLRISYGDCCLIPLLKMMMLIAAKGGIKVLGKTVANIDPTQKITLMWNDFFPNTPFDTQLQSQSLITLTQAGIISKKTALDNLRRFVDFGDLDDELAQIKAEQAEDQAREIETQTALLKAKPAISAGGGANVK